MADKYCSYDELRAAEAPDAFTINVADRNTPAVIVAPHGGKIELGTTQIATAVARDEFSVYSFDGRRNPTIPTCTSPQFVSTNRWPWRLWPEANIASPFTEPLAPRQSCL